jgi:glyoxylase-like metal-dependent hydrolase (beta-lactamase superfamily II)
MRFPGIAAAAIAIAVGLLSCAHATSTWVPALQPGALAVPGLTSSEIAPHTWELTVDEPYSTNVLLAEMPDGTLVLVDTLYTASTARGLLKALHDHFGTRPMVVIVTHFHLDRIGGDGPFLDAGVPIWGSEQTVRLLAERGETMRQTTVDAVDPGDAGLASLRAEMADEALRPPDHVFRAAHVGDGIHLTFGGETVEVFYPGAGHSPDNLVVDFPARRILFGGCLIKSGDDVGNLADADLAAWPASVKALQRFAPAIVVPGHGDRLDPGLLDHTIQVVEAAAKGAL